MNSDTAANRWAWFKELLSANRGDLPQDIYLAKKKRRQAFQDWEEALAQRSRGTSTTANGHVAEPPRSTVERTPSETRAAAQQQAPQSDLDADPTETLPHDVHLLERARTQWQFGQWHALAALDPDAIDHHPDRAKLALLAATGLAQRGQPAEARQMAYKAVDWGVDRELVKRLLLSGMHNSLARAAALAGQDKRVRRHFEDALNVGTPGAAAPMAVRARAETELTQIGLDQALPRLIPAAAQPDAPSYLKREAAQPGQELMVFLPDRSQRLIKLYPDHPDYLRLQGDRILFDVPEGASLVLSTNPDGQVANTPRQDLFGLAPATDYRVTGYLSCSNCSVSAWLVEYDRHERLSDHTDRTVDNRFDLQIRTSRHHARLCVALRIAGCGDLDLGGSVLRIQQLARPGNVHLDAQASLHY